MNRESKAEDITPAKAGQQVPWLEWLASGIGLLLVLAIFGVIGWQAFNDASTPPVITVEVGNVAPVEGGYRVLFRARNTAGDAAAQVEIEGKLSAAGAEAETSRVILDYIPGHSERHGGMFFTRDPRSGALAMRATGFAEP
ncbi:TIGR02588 family protein [Microvirga yunnanensis]|uniref:TIGR02588 family protein n=1 Tax=Microvirga yunnanensis TaxID=2953740 RepID=UPI0021CA10EF|nr:TIGR02588 family protein [Microvirga sp. HBU65207]